MTTNSIDLIAVDKRQDIDEMLATSQRTQQVFTRLYAEKNSDVVGGALSGWRISIKDNLDVAGERTMAGSLVCQMDEPATIDAPVVHRLRRSGAHIVGKTNMTEFAFSGVGINPHFGTPRNPADTQVARIPGGSSAGAAVSVGTGLVRAAIGTDTGGSVRIPAALCGLVGYKGSQSRVPLAGVLPLSQTLDTVGVIARNVRDTLAVDAVISQDPLPQQARDVRSLRLAIPQTLFFDDIEDAVAQAFESAVGRLRNAGAVIEPIAFDCVQEIGPRSKPGGFSPVECWRAHQHRLARSPESVDPRVITRVMLGKEVDAATYERFHVLRREWIALAQQQMQGFDALICPTVPIVAPEMAPLVADDEAFFKANRLLLRNPSMINYFNGCAWSLPIHSAGELPVGLMVASYEHQDAHLAGVVLGLEQALAR